MCNKDIPRKIGLMNQLRLLWTQHVYWTRFFIISTAANLADLEPVTNRLLRNPKDFARLLAPVYGEKTAERFQELFTQHLLIAADLVNAAKNGQTEKENAAREKWYQNAEEIAAFLSSINSCWSKMKWQNMLYSHLKMTEQEATLRLQGNYEADIKVFEGIEREALQMADYMWEGITGKAFRRCRQKKERGSDPCPVCFML